VTKYG